MNKSDNLLQPPSRPRLALRSPLTSEHSRSTSAFSAQESSEQSSNYLRYLSHLAAEQPCSGEDDYTVYWDIVTKCLLYLKREHLNDDYHDEILHALIKPHFRMDRLDPTPTDDLGLQLTRSGYFLAAYVLLLIRLRKSGNDLLQYFRESLARQRLSHGEAELTWYLGSDCAYIQGLCMKSTRGESEGSEKKGSPIVRTSTCDTMR